MKAAIVVFPGSNCDRDLAIAFERASGRPPAMVWHKDVSLPSGVDIVAIPGGFSFGDYLRCGAIAARSPICRAVVEFGRRGGHVLGICNGFQVLTETGLLPGALMRNAGLKFICKDVDLEVKSTNSAYTSAFRAGQTIRVPVAHHDGNYVADDTVMERLRGDGRIAFTYRDNPNGSRGDIAGIVSANRRVLGMMPHPERSNDVKLGGNDGSNLFDGICSALTAV